MKFNYTEVSTSNEYGLRWYKTKYGSYPSITTILSFTQSEEEQKILETWRNSIGHEEAARVSKRATDHGTVVHLLTERFFKGEDLCAPIDGEPVSQNDMNAFNVLKSKLKGITEVWGQEAPLYSSLHRVAGRCDLIGVYKGVPVIIDFKTSSRIKSKEHIKSYELQLLFYADAHNEMFGTDIKRGVILMVAQSGFPLEFIVDFTPELRSLLSTKIEHFYSKFNDKYKINEHE